MNKYLTRIKYHDIIRNEKNNKEVEGELQMLSQSLENPKTVEEVKPLCPFWPPRDIDLLKDSWCNRYSIEDIERRLNYKYSREAIEWKIAELGFGKVTQPVQTVEPVQTKLNLDIDEPSSTFYTYNELACMAWNIKESEIERQQYNIVKSIMLNDYCIMADENQKRNGYSLYNIPDKETLEKILNDCREKYERFNEGLFPGEYTALMLTNEALHINLDRFTEEQRSISVNINKNIKEMFEKKGKEAPQRYYGPRKILAYRMTDEEKEEAKEIIFKLYDKETGTCPKRYILFGDLPKGCKHYTYLEIGEKIDRKNPASFRNVIPAVLKALNLFDKGVTICGNGGKLCFPLSNEQLDTVVSEVKKRRGIIEKEQVVESKVQEPKVKPAPVVEPKAEEPVKSELTSNNSNIIEDLLSVAKKLGSTVTVTDIINNPQIKLSFGD